MGTFFIKKWYIVRFWHERPPFCAIVGAMQGCAKSTEVPVCVYWKNTVLLLFRTLATLWYCLYRETTVLLNSFQTSLWRGKHDKFPSQDRGLQLLCADWEWLFMLFQSLYNIASGFIHSVLKVSEAIIWQWTSLYVLAIASISNTFLHINYISSGR